MRIALSSDTWPAQNRSFRGDWHLESAPDPIQPGTLSLEPTQRPSLRLDGPLTNRERPDYSYHSIIGLSQDAEDITLILGGYRSQRAPWFSRVDYGGKKPPVIEEVWDGYAVAIGAKLPLGGATRVQQMVFRSRRLRDWARAIAPEFNEAVDAQLIGGTVELPEPLEVNLGWGKVTLQWGVVGHSSTHGANFRFFPEMLVDFTNPPTIDETWSLVITPLLQFFTLATGEGDYLECVRYRGEEPDDGFGSPGIDSYGQSFYGGWFEWVSASWFAHPNDKPDVWDFSHILPARETAAELATMLPRWIELQARASEPLADYFATLMWVSMTFEEHFAHLVRSLEVIHSIIQPGTRIPAPDFRAIRKKIKAALEGDPHRELIMSRLSHADEYSLLDRLTALLDTVGDRLLGYVGDVGSFARKVRDSRDSFTHTSDLRVLEHPELQNAQTILDLLMRSVLLMQLGISKQEADERVLRTEASRVLQYPVDRN